MYMHSLCITFHNVGKPQFYAVGFTKFVASPGSRARPSQKGHPTESAFYAMVSHGASSLGRTAMRDVHTATRDVRRCLVREND